MESLESNKKLELEQIKQNLEDAHKEQLKKKDNDKSMFEKLQEKVRDELKKKLEQEEKENKLK
jgi:hypothetical protein